jgi:hypothetical protein
MEPRNILLWKNFTNIDRIATKVGSNEAPGCTFDYEAVRSRCDDRDWWLSGWCWSHFGRSEANWRMERQYNMEELEKTSEAEQKDEKREQHL